MPAGWPPWWDWELRLSGHILLRMEDRGFTEMDLRLMMERAYLLIPDRTRDRWIVSTRHRRRHWLVVVEPDESRRILVVITAYPQ